MHIEKASKKQSQKIIAILLTVAMVISLFASMSTTASAEDNAKMKITYGNDVITITETEYDSLKPITATYSSLSKEEASSTEFTGVALTDVLSKAGIDVSKLDDDQTIKFTSAADSLSKTLTIKDLFKTERYAYALKEGVLIDDDTKTEVVPIIATSQDGANIDAKLVFGQSSTDDFNKSGWVSDIVSADVSTVTVSNNEWEGSIAAGFESGTGTKADPYLIANGDQLAFLSKQVNEGKTYEGKFIQLSKNINLNDIEFNPIGGGAKLEDGTATYKFNGTFDGNGKTIKNLNIDAKTNDGAEPNFTGLFGFNAGTIKDLTVSGAVTCTSTAGNNTGANPTSNFVGSIVGFNCGTIKRVFSKVALTAMWSGNVGGIAGFNASEKWRDSTTGSDVNRTIEGAVGLITECGNEGYIKSYKKIGGITGENEGIISNCYNHGNIYTCFGGSGNGQAGISGRTGCNNAEWGIGHIVNCYNTGATNTKALESDNNYFDSRWISGITGFTSKNSTVTNCYTVGTIYKGYDDYAAIAPRGDSLTTLVNNYSLDTIIYNSDLEGVTARIGIQKSESEMKASQFLTDLGGGYVADIENTNNGYPILRWQSGSTATVRKVELTSNPTVTDYIDGQNFDTSGMVLTATYSDGSTQKLSSIDYKISNADELKTSDTSETISGSFEGIDFSFNIGISVAENQLDSIRVVSAPNKIYYKVGDVFDPTGMRIYIKYTNGKSEYLTDGFTTTDTALAKGSNKISVSYKLKAVTKTDSFDVEAIDISKSPEKDSNGIYQIKTAEELKAFSDMVGKLGMSDLNAKLVNNIDASNTEFSPIGAYIKKVTTTESGVNLNSYIYNVYAGIFDGNIKTVKLNINNDATYTGFFGVLGAATVKNLTVTGKISSTGSNIGGIAGGAYNGAPDIRGCTNKANVSGAASTGGILGAGISTYGMAGNIVNCRNMGSVNGTQNIGGIVGNGAYTQITNCINNGSIIGTSSNIGGIAGVNSLEMVKCGNTGNINGTNNTAGIVGSYKKIAGSLDNLYNTGNVNGTYSVGGICGTGYTGNMMTNCYNQGAITASEGSAAQGVGGLIGSQGNYEITLENCYNTGIVAGTNGTIKVGELVGYLPKNATINNSYYMDSHVNKSFGGANATATVTDNSSSKTSEEFENLAETLGDAYENNNTYPSFIWEWNDWYNEEISLLKEHLEEAEKTNQEIADQVESIKKQLEEAEKTNNEETSLLKEQLKEAEKTKQETMDQAESLKKQLEEATKSNQETLYKLDILYAQNAKMRVAGKITVSAPLISYRSTKLSWTTISTAQGYEIYKATSLKGEYVKVATVADSDVVTLNQTGLSIGKTYYYKVRAYVTYSDSAAKTYNVYGNYSAVKKVKPMLAKARANVKSGKNKVTVKWKTVSGAMGYQVSVSTSKNKIKVVKNLSASKKTYRKTKLKKGKAYYVEVRAFRKVNGKKIYGAWSLVKKVKTK